MNIKLDYIITIDEFLEMIEKQNFAEFMQDL